MTTAASTRSPRRRLLLGAVAALLVVGAAFAWQPARRFWRIYWPAQQDLPLPSQLWAMATGPGAAVTQRNRGDADFQPMTRAFESQIHGTYCGVASAVIALNSLGGSATQGGFFGPKAEAVRPQHDVFYGGMTLDELGQLLTAHGATTRVVHAGDSSVDGFRAEARANVEGAAGAAAGSGAVAGSGAPPDVLLINYDRKSLGQKGGGHISPVAAYDADTDRFLVLDVSSYKYPPVWVATAALFKAMNTIDSGAKLSRGWVHVRLLRAP